MDKIKCFLCEDALNNGKETVVVTRGLRGLLAASVERNDGRADLIGNLSSVTVHVLCRKKYTRKSTILKEVKETNAGVAKEDEENRLLRSSLPSFDFMSECLFCGEEASQKKETKKKVKYRRVVYEVRTLVFKTTVLVRCKERQDDWGRVVQSRVESVQDLVAAEAKYHTECHLRFFTPTPSSSSRGRREDEEKSKAFRKLTDFMEANDECQFLLDDLLKQMQGPESSSSPGDGTYGRQYLKKKLKAHYHEGIVITDIPGKSSIVNFKGTADQLLQEKWYSGEKNTPADKRQKIVEAAAKIVREDIRQMTYNCDEYPGATADAINNEDIIPASLKLFLSGVIHTRDPQADAIKRKRNALGQAIVSACRPRSFVPPILVALGVYVHRKYASKQLIQLLNSLGFSVNMAEVQRYEYAVLREQRPPPSTEEFIQFCFDNADFNIRTLDGKNTFHCMGGIKCTAQASMIETPVIPRLCETPKAAEIAGMGKFNISWYRKPPLSGLKAVEIKDLLIHIPDSLTRATAMDTLWLAGIWAGVTLPPSWNGYMKISSSLPSAHFQTTTVEALPFINLEPSNPSTIYSALRFASQQCKKQGQKTCFVTFDQPLYAKAVDIVASDTSGEFKNTVIRLGGFHLLMSYLGAIGYVMSGSGLEDLWESIYAKNSVVHMMTGHAYSRSLRAHFLTQQALGTILLGMIDTLQESDRHEIRTLFYEQQAHSPSDVLSSFALRLLEENLSKLLFTLSGNSRTSLLWVEYFKQVNLVKLFIRAERCGDWQLHLFCVKNMLPLLHASGHIHYSKSAHLYVQQMEELPHRMNPVEFSKFTLDGFFTIRRGHDFWSGTWTDMVIEQNLMRAMKVKGGLVHGRGLTNSVLAQWILSAPGCLKLCDSLEAMAGMCASSTEQHVELRGSWRSRDNRDVEIFIDWLNSRSPFQVSKNLLSISSGVVADRSINCDRALQIGKDALRAIAGLKFGDVKLKRSLKVKPLSSMTMSVNVRDDVVAVNPTQLFLRIVCVMKTEHDLMAYLKYELAPKPPSLFDEVSLWKTTKSTLTEVLPSKEASSSRYNDETKVVIDGGYLLHAVVWPKPADFKQVTDVYLSFVEQYSSAATVVFDGYGNLTTKDQERLRRCTGKVSAKISVEENVPVTSRQDEFLKNEHNKNGLIRILVKKLQKSGHCASQCEGDADASITACALEFGSSQNVVVISNDTDVLVMLTARASEESRIEVLHPPTSKAPGKVFNITEVSKSIGPMKTSILVCHSFTGCDTTSAFFGKGKKLAWKLLKENPSLRETAEKFLIPNAGKGMIVSAGEELAMALYGHSKSPDCQTLDELRAIQYSRKIATQPVTAAFQLSSLPPTTAACEQHSLRCYLQTQEWLGNTLDPVSWGWKVDNGVYVPVTTNLPPAPDHLLNLVSCNCKSSCASRCECVRSGLECSLMCGHCRGSACANVTYSNESSEDDDDDLLS